MRPLWPWNFVKGVIYMILHIWQALRLSGTTFVRKVCCCIKFEYVCKPVFGEHNQPVEATYSQVTKLGRRGTMTCFTKIHIYLWLLGQIRWGLHWIVEKLFHKNCFIIRFDFSDSIKGSFAIDTQMPIVIFLGTIGIVRNQPAFNNNDNNNNSSDKAHSTAIASLCAGKEKRRRKMLGERKGKEGCTRYSYSQL